MMKKITTIICLLLCLPGYAHAKERVIDRPPFVAWSTNTIEIDKIVLSDTATVLHIKAYYRPNYWIKIAPKSVIKANSGETYLLRQSIGITPGKEFWMPESGEGEFQLIFPPLPAKVTSIDFLEAESERPFNIYGIQLKGTKLPKLVLPKEAIAHKTDNKASLPLPETTVGTATLKGKLLEYRPGMIDGMELNLSEPIKGFVEGLPIVINPDGSFSLETSIMGTTPASIYLFGKKIKFFLTPEQTTELIINTRELCRLQSKLQQTDKPNEVVVYVNGPMASVVQELNQSTAQSIIKNAGLTLKEIENMDTGAYKLHIVNKHAERQQKINQSTIGKAVKQLLCIDNDIDAAQNLSMVPHMLTQAKIEKKELTREESAAYFTKLQQELPTDYYNSMQKFESINTPMALLSDKYAYTIYMFSQIANKLEQTWGTNQGVIFDLVAAAKIYQGIKDFNSLNDNQKEQLSTLPHAYRTLIESENVKLLAKIEANKKKNGFTVNEIGEVSNEDLFASIIAKFRGKVVLVDFWATWCGPCRTANKLMIPMKEALQDKEIVYLYLAGENSPLKTWENMIPDIHGEHFRVTTAQWKYLVDAFKVEGVPTYILVDREGNIVYKKIGFPGVEALKEQLLKAVNK